MPRLTAFLALLVLAGCGSAPGAKSQAVELGAEVTLAPGATASAKNADVMVRFVSVIEDSRCPRDVTCIWAGEVKVRLEIYDSSKVAAPVEILEGGSAAAGAHRVKLVRVEPQPVSTAPIAPQDYRAILLMDKPQ